MNRKQFKVSERFFALKQKKTKMKIMNQMEEFERIKRFTVFQNDSYVYRGNCNNKMLKKKTKVEDIEEIKEINKRLFNLKIEKEGKNLADMMLNIEKDESITRYQEDQSNIVVSHRNLQNAIARRRILRGKGRYNEEDEILGISDVNQFRHKRNLTLYDISRTLKNFKGSKFLKNKFRNNTLVRYKGVNGKFFGVVC